MVHNVRGAEMCSGGAGCATTASMDRKAKEIHSCRPGFKAAQKTPSKECCRGPRRRCRRGAWWDQEMSVCEHQFGAGGELGWCQHGRTWGHAPACLCDNVPVADYSTSKLKRERSSERILLVESIETIAVNGYLECDVNSMCDPNACTPPPVTASTCSLYTITQMRVLLLATRL